MVFSISPSVTVREIDATASIPAIATPPAAIAGVFRWGPVNEKILVTSETELASRFGKPTNDNAETFFVAADYLSYSNALYVTRVVSDEATTAIAQEPTILATQVTNLRTQITSQTALITTKNNQITAKNAEIDALEAIVDPTQLQIDALAAANAQLVILTAELATLNTTLATLNTQLTNALSSSTYFKAKYPGSLGNALRVGYISGSESYEQPLLDNFTVLRNFIPNTELDNIPAANPVPNQITVNTNEFVLIGPNEFTVELKPNDILKVGNSNIGFQNLIVDTVTPSTITEIVSTSAGNPAVITNEPTVLQKYIITFKNRYTLSETRYNALTYTRMWGYSYLFAGAPVSGSMHIVVADRTGGISGIPGSILEVYENVSRNPNATLSDGSNNYYRTVIENRSGWITADTAPNDPILAELGLLELLDDVANASNYEDFIGGVDGLSESAIPLGKLAEGYDLYKDSQEIDIAFVLQGKANGANLANYIISNIADRRKDCVAFISPQRGDVVDVANPQEKLLNVIAFRNLIQPSSYFFMDSGYKYRYDKYNDVYRWIPLNGDMAGLCSRIDPWESPAGYKRGIIKNVVKLAFNPNKEQRDQLYGSDVNPVISQVGQGVLLFGDKTGLGTATGSAFTRINVRRLFIVVEKAIATVSASFLFDFNDEFTQTQFKNLVEPFLRDIQGRRGIIDFRVIADSTVNTPDVIDRNMFRGNIFIKPARTINFIELTFIATRTGVEFDEIIGQSL